MRYKTSNLLKSILRTAACFLEQSGDAAEDAGDRVAAGFDRASDRVSDRMSDLRDRARDLVVGEDHTVRNVMLFAAGVGVGVGVGVLFAPASGEETRSSIGDRVEEFRGQVRDRVSRVRTATGTEGP